MYKHIDTTGQVDHRSASCAATSHTENVPTDRQINIPYTHVS